MPEKSDDDLTELFPPKEGELPCVEDVTMGEEPVGLGFPGEVFHLKCPECEGHILRLRQSKVGRLFYGCETYPACNASHGAYPDGRPMGIPGNKETREARKFAHRVFDRLWLAEDGHKPVMRREQAYVWVQRTLNLSANGSRIAMFSVEQCHALVDAVRREHPSVMNAWDRLTSANPLDELDF